MWEGLSVICGDRVRMYIFLVSFFFSRLVCVSMWLIWSKVNFLFIFLFCCFMEVLWERGLDRFFSGVRFGCR